MNDPRRFPDSLSHEVSEGSRLDALTLQVQGLRGDMRHAVAEGVQQGIKTLAEDPKFGELFWQQGFKHMSAHATAAGSQWIGSRILTALVLAMVSAGVAWLVKSGKI